MLYLTGPARGRPKNNDGPAQPGPKVTKKWRAGPRPAREKWRPAGPPFTRPFYKPSTECVLSIK